jgi:flavin-dependent dehydrogenase
LAQAGRRVLVLEKVPFPRFHIGESLLPAGLTVLKRLGIEFTPDVFVYKRGARFVCEVSGRQQTFAFQEALAGCARHAWHVERSKFDTLLRDKAREHGAEVVHGVSVDSMGVDGDVAWLKVGSETYTGRYVVDASGQSRLSARLAGSAVAFHRFGAAAAFTHYEDISEAAMAELGPDFDIRILVRADGWGWVIPLAGRRLSVGLVSARHATPELLESGVLQGPLVRRLTAGARRLDTHVVANFSYRNTRCASPRFCAVGDAACFLDPVFSSGVTLALHAAESLCDRLVPALAEGREAAADLLDQHLVAMDRAYRTFAGLIDRFYNTRIAQQLFLGDSQGMPSRSGVLSVLAGDVWRHDNPFQDMLLNAVRLPVEKLDVR